MPCLCIPFFCMLHLHMCCFNHLLTYTPLMHALSTYVPSHHLAYIYPAHIISLTYALLTYTLLACTPPTCALLMHACSHHLTHIYSAHICPTCIPCLHTSHLYHLAYMCTTYICSAYIHLPHTTLLTPAPLACAPPTYVPLTCNCLYALLANTPLTSSHLCALA